MTSVAIGFGLGLVVGGLLTLAFSLMVISKRADEVAEIEFEVEDPWGYPDGSRAKQFINRHQDVPPDATIIEFRRQP